MVFQEPMTSLNPVLPIGRQIIEALPDDERRSRTAASARAVELLASVGLTAPERRLSEYPHQISGGMRQRVMIAIALASRPALIIADEPTTALDVTVQAQIVALLRQIQDESGTALLLVSHDLALVWQMARRVAVMYAGRIVEQASVEALFARPRHPYSAGLVGAIRALAAGGRNGWSKFPALRPGLPNAGRDALSRPVAGKPPPSAPAPRPRTESPAISRKPRDDRAAGNQRTGEAFPAAGRARAAGRRRRFAVDRAGRGAGARRRSGCGKSTLGRCLLRLEEIDGGEIRFDGQRIDALRATAFRPLRQRIQMVFQDPYGSLDPRMTVAEILAEPLTSLGLVRNRHDAAPRVLELLDMVRMPRSCVAKKPHEFSGGQRQRIGIARALATWPDLLVCDEAVSALDVSVKAQIVNLLSDLRAELGLAMLFISHDLAIVERIADRVAVMYLGRIVETGDAEAIFSSPGHPYTRGLLAAAPRIDALSPPTGCCVANRPIRRLRRRVVVSTRAVRKPSHAARPTTRRPFRWCPAGASPATLPPIPFPSRWRTHDVPFPTDPARAVDGACIGGTGSRAGSAAGGALRDDGSPAGVDGSPRRCRDISRRALDRLRGADDGSRPVEKRHAHPARRSGSPETAACRAAGRARATGHAHMVRRRAYALFPRAGCEGRGANLAGRQRWRGARSTDACAARCRCLSDRGGRRFRGGFVPGLSRLPHAGMHRYARGAAFGGDALYEPERAVLRQLWRRAL
jgi:peptide/nickel transport system ATP-binding protein